MTFNENDVNRDKGGKFDHKEGSAPDIMLPLDDLDGHASADVQNDLLDIIQSRGPIAASKMQPVFGANDEVSDLDREFANNVRFASLFTIPDPADEVPLPSIDDSEPHAQQNIQQVTELLNSEHLVASGVTSDDLGKLRQAIERAEYTLVDSEIKDYLAANHPEVTGVLVESDGYDSPQFIGLEIEDGTERQPGRNYGHVVPFGEKYGVLYAHLYNHSEDIARFQDRGSFDEYASVLTDDNEQYGRFNGLEGFVDSDTPVYRMAERSA